MFLNMCVSCHINNSTSWGKSIIYIGFQWNSTYEAHHRVLWCPKEQKHEWLEICKRKRFALGFFSRPCAMHAHSHTHKLSILLSSGARQVGNA